MRATGTTAGTNGIDPVKLACAALLLLFAAICTVNVLSILDETARNGVRVATWRPLATEYSSLAGFIAALPVAVLAERRASRRRRLPGLAILLAGSLLYSLVHVTTMVGLRDLVWWSRGGHYDFDLANQWLYEYRKDLVGFAITLAALFVARRWRPAAAMAADTSRAATVVPLPNGRRQVEVDLAELVAVAAAGNYAELRFASGRTRLLRTTLAAAADALAAHGFRRTHKSWLVRSCRVAAVQRTAAGDYALLLDGGGEAPLSRRSGALLDEIRASAAARESPLPIA